MTAVYDRMVTTVYKALKKYGRPVILRQYSASSADYNPATGGAIPTGTDGSNDSTVLALVSDQPGSRLSERYGSNTDGQTLVQQGEKWLYLEATGAAPRLQDKIIFDSVEYQVIDVQLCQPGLTVIFYLVVLIR